MTRPPARVVVVPPAPVLLPACSSLTDPVADLRAACRAAVAWLGPDVEVVADDDLGRRVGEQLVREVRSGGFETGAERPPQPADGSAERPPQPADGSAGRPPQPADGGVRPGVLVMANGSACRSERAPGHLDERARDFDDALGAALAAGDLAALAEVDVDLGEELLASGLRSLAEVAGRSGLRVAEARVDYGEDPFGVMWWVVRWQCGS